MAPNPSNPISPVYTPWRHTSELALIRDWFYPSYALGDPYSAQSPDMRQTAVQHVHMWSFKDLELPHAIMATATLTDAMLHDTMDRRKFVSDWALRSVYAMAFCRFVNGFVDRDIAKAALMANAASKVDADDDGTTGNEERAARAATTTSRGESSMYAHAAAIGLPEQFVDLRHRATHDEMPSLEKLRQMARKALDWLWERWWKVQATDNPDRALRERDERRLLAAEKAEARTASQVVQAIDTDLADAVASEGDALERGTNKELGTGAMRVDLVDEDLSGASVRKGKRKRGDRNGAGVDGVRSETGPDRHSHEKLPRPKVKRNRLQSAFGLFESN